MITSAYQVDSIFFGPNGTTSLFLIFWPFKKKFKWTFSLKKKLLDQLCTFDRTRISGIHYENIKNWMNEIDGPEENNTHHYFVWTAWKLTFSMPWHQMSKRYSKKKVTILLKEKRKLLHPIWTYITWSHKSYHLTILFVVVSLWPSQNMDGTELVRVKNIIIIMISKIKISQKSPHFVPFHFLFRRFYDERYPVFSWQTIINFFYVNLWKFHQVTRIESQTLAFYLAQLRGWCPAFFSHHNFFYIN